MIKNLFMPLVFTLIFILGSAQFIFGNIYFWVDEKGTKHYTNTSPPLNGNVQELEESHAILKKITAKKNQKQKFKVLKIYDGDTIKVKGLGLVFKIRMVGIDAPETGYKRQPGQAFSKKAKRYLENLLKDTSITLKSYGTGGYNRQLAEIFLENDNINIKMLQAGLAEVYKGKRPKGLDSNLYLNEEKIAKAAQKGMWVQGRSYKSPKKWRREHPRK